MADIKDLTESWEGHSGKEVSDFIKAQLTSVRAQAGGKVGYIEREGSTISFYDDEGKGTLLGTVVLSGKVYTVEISASEDSTFNVLTSETSKALTFSAVSWQSELGSDERTAVTEDYSFAIGVDNGSGTFSEVQTGAFQSGGSVTVNVRNWLTTGQNRLRLAVTGNETGQQTTKIFTVNMTTLFFESTFGWQRPWIEGETFVLDGIRFSGNLQKTLYVAIDGDASVVPPQSFPTGTNYTSTSYSLSLTDYFPDMEHSSIHTIEIWMEGGGVRTRSYRYNVMCVTASEKLTAQLIAINNLKEKASNYVSETLFQYAVYNVTQVTFATTVTDGTRTMEGEDTVTGIQTRTVNGYTSLIEFETEQMDGVTLTILATAGDTTEVIVLGVDNSTAFIPTQGATFYFNASNRSNGSANRELIINQVSGASTAEYQGVWSGFSFGDTDGWTYDGGNSRALVAKAGCHVTFPELRILSKAQTQSIAIELKFKSDNIADYDTPVLSFGTTVNGQKQGIFLYPTKLTVLSDSSQNQILQSIGLEEGEIHHVVIVFHRDYGGTSGRNLCSIYMNGNRNIHFSYEGTATFGDGCLEIGQDSTDFCLYMMRFYEKPLESGDVLANFLNTIVDGTEFTRSGVRDDNNILDGGVVSYEMAKKAGYNVMVVETDDALPDIGHTDSSGKTCTLHMEYGRSNARNFSVTKCALSGQGTTSMKYYRWNLRFKTKDGSVWTYADGTSSTGKKGWFDGANEHPKVADIVAKKNYASAMQGHKMGAVGLYDDLYKIVVGSAGLPEGARVAVYQYPVLGFQKFRDGTYQYIGLYTVGPHKGDKGTFGYDGDAFPALMSLEGPNHAPLGTRFLHAWQNVDYDYTEETLTFGGEEAWDADFIAGKETDSESDKASILAMYEHEWKPAYEQVFFCSPYLVSLGELDTSYNTIAKINAAVTAFRQGKTSGTSNSLLQIYNPSNYALYAYNNASKAYVAVEHDMLDYLASYLPSGVSTPTRSQLVDARVAKFRAEANNFWATDSLLFHYCFCVLIAATDNFAKNMYPFKFKTLEQGGRWAFRQDDLDSILDTDNNGQQTKKYSVLAGDVTGDGVQIFQGADSALYALVERAFADSLNAKMLQLVNGCATIAGNLGIAGDTRHETLYNVFANYFWNGSAKYFPQEAYNKDTEWSYITPWLANPSQQYNNVYPLTQARGDAQYSEREWVKKHIAFLFSRYLIGGFTGDSGDYGVIAFTTTSSYTFNIRPAIDLYPVINLGGGQNTQGVRTQAGTVCPMTVGSTGDTTLYILGAHWLSELGDLSRLVLTNRGGDAQAGVELSVTGKRLRRLKIGDAAAENVLFNSVSVALTNTPALEVFDARNTRSLTKTVDLSACTRLRRILLSGSTAPGLIIPEGAQLEQISFPDSLSTLFLRSLPNITYAMLNMSVACEASIRALYIYNCPLLDPIATLIRLWESGGSLQYITLMWDYVLTGTKDYFKALYYIAQNKAYAGEEEGEIVTVDRTYGYVGYENGTTSTEAGTPIIEGTVYVDDFINVTEWEVVTAKWPNLTIECKGKVIQFVDAEAKRICVKNWGGATGGSTHVEGLEGELTVEQAAAVSSLGTNLRSRNDITAFPELYYFGVSYPDQNLGIGWQNADRRSGPMSLVVTPRTLKATAVGFVGNAQIHTLVIPSLSNAANYTFYRLLCTDLIILADPVPAFVNSSWQTYDSSITNLYVPDHLVGAYKGFPFSGWGKTPKALSSYDGAYKQVVQKLYNEGILDTRGLL